MFYGVRKKKKNTRNSKAKNVFIQSKKPSSEVE